MIETVVFICLVIYAYVGFLSFIDIVNDMCDTTWLRLMLLGVIMFGFYIPLMHVLKWMPE